MFLSSRASILSVITILFTIACQTTGKRLDEGEVLVTLKGKVNAPAEGAYVYLERIGLENVERIDSTLADSKGNFTFQIALSSPSMFIVNFFNRQQEEIVLSSNNPEVYIEADGDRMGGMFSVKGSSDTECLQAYKKLAQELRLESDSVRRMFYTGALDRLSAENAFVQINKKASTQARQLIDTYPYSIATIFAVNLLDPDREIAYMLSLHQKLSEAHPTSEYVKNFGEHVNQIKITAIGQPAPEISLANPNGDTIPLSSLKGKYVLIDFWASWCTPCRQENPNVVRMYNKFREQSFEIYGVSLDEDKEAWVNAIKKDGLMWHHVSDLKKWQSPVVAQYRLEGIPATILIDKNGLIIDKNLRGQALEDRLTDLLTPQ